MNRLNARLLETLNIKKKKKVARDPKHYKKRLIGTLVENVKKYYVFGQND